MSKILLAIDYGINNIGIVLFNKKKKIIFNYKNIYFLFFFKKIKKYIIKYKINNIIIGWPINYQNKKFKIINYIKKMLLLIINIFPNISYNFIDERFTSSYIKKIFNIKKNNKIINKLSAIIILKSFLKKNNHV